MIDDLIGNTVRVDKHTLPIVEMMYPNFLVKDKLLYDKNNCVIYTGKPLKLDLLEKGTKQFINTVGQYNIDFTDREQLAGYMFNLYGKELKPEVADYLKGLDDVDFYNNIKTLYVIGTIKVDEQSTTIYDLYMSLLKSKNERYDIFFSLLDTYSESEIESSLITFIEKSCNYENIESKPHYKKLLKEFYTTYGDKLRSLLVRYNKMNDEKRIKLFWLLSSL